MKRTYKIRLYPTDEQKELIDNSIEEARKFYNYLLNADNEWYTLNQRGPNNGRLKFYENVRKNYEFKYLPMHCQQQVSRNLNRSFNNFFNKKHKAYKKKLRFKRYGKFRSIVFPSVKLEGESGPTKDTRIDFSTKQIWFVRIGKIQANFGNIQIDGKPKQIRLKKSGSGKYFAFVTIEVNSQQIQLQSRNGSIGIDLGINKFLVTSNAEIFCRPRFTNRHYRNQLKRAQRRLSRKKKGSKNWLKQLRRLNVLHEKIANRRRDHHFKVAHWLVTNYDKIYYEDFKVSSIVKKSYSLKKGELLRKLIYSVAWYEFRTILIYMSMKYDVQCIGVNPRNTTQICSHCGAIVPKSLSQRVHRCPHCGLVVDRDLNVAWNIHDLGEHGTTGCRGTTGLVTSQSTLVEISVNGEHWGRR